MKASTVVFVGVVVSAASARAELTSLGDFALGQKLAKAKFAKGSALGCTGSFRQGLDSGKIREVSFSPDGACQAAALEAQLEKEYGGKPIVSVDKTVKLWEGKTGSAMLISSRSGSLTVKVLRPGNGAKRACFADDGFAAFWKNFVATVEQPAAVAASFAFPVKNYDDKVVIKDAKALAKQWPTLIDPADRKELATGSVTPSCSVDTATYDLSLPESNLGLEARVVRGGWKFVEINHESPD